MLTRRGSESGEHPPGRRRCDDAKTAMGEGDKHDKRQGSAAESRSLPPVGAPSHGSQRAESGEEARTEPSILAALPRTRPQRSSPRRASRAQTSAMGGELPGKPMATGERAARAAPATKQARAAKPRAAKEAASQTRRTGASTAEKRSAREAAQPSRTRPPRRREPPAPKQGYEAQEEARTGSAVHPPSGAELVESVATIFGELAAAGLKAGGRALKDALGPLRRP
jgi:hypothetical protein